MFGRRTKEYYNLSEAQFEQMKRFYEKLGFNKRQIKRLCSKCFGAEIRVAKGGSGNDEWVFSRQIDYIHSEPEEECGAICEDAMEGPVARCAMPAPMMSSAMAGGAMNAVPAGMMGMMGMPAPGTPAQFSTAETHVSPENEQHSPLDQSQIFFSANVNTASWDHVRSRILRNKKIDKDFVRVEEIINSYRYTLPEAEDELFSISVEKGDCPWKKDDKLLLVGLRGKKADTNVRQNLSLLVDVSGSMDDQWVLTQMSIAAIVSKLRKGDVISIIAYSDETVTVVKQLDCEDMDACIDAIMDVDGIGGCTNGSEGLDNAYKYLEKHFDKDANNRVFIFTDGDFNFGVTSEGGLKEFIEKKKKTGIYLSIVGFGERNFKDNKMETLARNGNGNYTFVSNPYDILDNLSDKLISNLVTVAKDVKISIEFNPALVSEYRLIGYDSRMLTQQEFHDTEKAVDGIGSEHNVVALIQMKEGKAEKKYSSRYVKVETGDNDQELAFVEIHYKSPDDKDMVMTKTILLSDIKEKKTSSLPVAADLAAFGMLVKDSEYKGDLDKDLLGKLNNDCMASLEIKEPAPYSHFYVIRKYAGV